LPGIRTGIRLSGLAIANKLPKTFSDIIKVPGLGHSIHHKFVVVDFKGKDLLYIVAAAILPTTLSKKTATIFLK